LALSCTTATAQQRGDAGGKPPDLAAMAEDIEIMQRVIDKTLQSHFGDARLVLGNMLREIDAGEEDDEEAQDAPADELTSIRDLPRALAYGRLAYSYALAGGYDVVGYYVPRKGAIFTLAFPAAVRPLDEDEDDTPAKDDLWGQTEGEVRGTRPRDALGFATGGPLREFTVDDEALEATIAKLIGAIGKYGGRIEQLASDDSIILAARVTAQSPSDLASGILTGTYTMLHVDVSKYRLIIEVPVSAIRAYDANRIDIESLIECARVTRYPAHESSGTTRFSGGAGGRATGSAATSGRSGGRAGRTR
jgi:hypothetical protein